VTGTVTFTGGRTLGVTIANGGTLHVEDGQALHGEHVTFVGASDIRFTGARGLITGGSWHGNLVADHDLLIVGTADTVDCSKGTITVGGNMVAAKLDIDGNDVVLANASVTGPAASGSYFSGMGADTTGAKITGFEQENT